jgi:hypothetical protein
MPQSLDQIRQLGTKMAVRNLVMLRDDQLETYFADIRVAMAELTDVECATLVNRLGELRHLAAVVCMNRHLHKPEEAAE